MSAEKKIDVERLAEAILNLCNGIESAAYDCKRQIAQLAGIDDKEKATTETKQATVKEETFNILKFEAQKGEKLGEYEVAHKSSNLPEKWTHAYAILRQNNAVINSRFKDDGYQFSYWIYGEDRIYRQKLKQKT